MAFIGQLLLACAAVSALTTAYPLYGPKRYRTYSPLPVYSPRSPRPYAPYYDPYPQELSEVVDLYPQDPYDRYRYHQVPYYFPDPTPYYYDDEQVPEEEEYSEDPYSQEWYNQDGNAKANAYFLQNLMLAQMYNDAQSRYPVTYGYPKDDYDDYVYGEPVNTEPKEDDDVSQLKSLVKDSPKRRQLKNQIQQLKTKFSDNKWSESKRTTDKKGQEEIVMPRPSNAVRTPLFHQRAHEPTAYDAIKKMLHIESQQV